jgi:hypothetical protein
MVPNARLGLDANDVVIAWVPEQKIPPARIPFGWKGGFSDHSPAVSEMLAEASDERFVALVTDRRPDPVQ